MCYVIFFLFPQRFFIQIVGAREEEKRNSEFHLRFVIVKRKNDNAMETILNGKDRKYPWYWSWCWRERANTYIRKLKVEESRFLSDVKINDGQFCNLCYPHESFMRRIRTVCKFSYLYARYFFFKFFPYVFRMPAPSSCYLNLFELVLFFLFICVALLTVTRISYKFNLQK